MSDFRFLICPVLSSVPVGEIDISDVTFTQSVDGTGTMFTGSAFLSDTQTGDKLKSLLNYPSNPKAVALYVLSGDQYIWGGPLQSRPWDKDRRAFNLTATSWKAWLYERFLQPNTAVNPVTDVKYSWTNTDQFAIAQALVNYATTGYGTPTIVVGTETSGVNRDMTIFASEFVTFGEAIDRMASRERGFEWDIELRTDSIGNPQLRFVPYYPKKVGLNAGVIFKSTPTGGNIIKYSNPEDTAETVITRVWGTGAGTAGADLLMAYDQDPLIPNDTVLLTESKEYSNSSTSVIATIASHVQGIRKFHATGLQQIQITVPLDDPNFADYNIGNKVRLILQDEIQDIDYDAVRIVRRTFRVNAASSAAAADQADLLIDLNDTKLPEDEESL